MPTAEIINYNCVLFVISFSLFQYFVEAGAIAVRRVRKEDMRHVAKATGATLVISLTVSFMMSVFQLTCLIRRISISSKALCFFGKVTFYVPYHILFPH